LLELELELELELLELLELSCFLYLPSFAMPSAEEEDEELHSFT